MRILVLHPLPHLSMHIFSILTVELTIDKSSAISMHSFVTAVTHSSGNGSAASYGTSQAQGYLRQKPETPQEREVASYHLLCWAWLR
jgi:hypothetical protein